MNITYLLFGLAVMSIVTGLLRLIPFLIFNGSKPTPPYILYMGKVLPPAIIGMLVIYCYKDIQFTPPFFIPSEIIAGIIVIILHKWKRSSLLSIGIGTAVNVILKMYLGM